MAAVEPPNYQPLALRQVLKYVQRKVRTWTKAWQYIGRVWSKYGLPCVVRSSIGRHQPCGEHLTPLTLILRIFGN